MAVNDSWVDDRLAALTPDSSWQPAAAAHRGSVESRRAVARHRRLKWAGVLVAATTIFVSVPVTRTFAAKCLEACVSATTSVSQLWRADEPEAGAPRFTGMAIGDIAPDEVGADRDGNAQRLSSRRGKFVVLNFWATWCGPCKAEVPLLNDLQSRFGPTGVEVIGVSIDDTGWADVNTFVSAQRIGYTVTLADAQTIETYGGVNQLPMTLVIDRNGRIIAKHIGLLTDRGDFHQQIERMLVR